MSYRLLSLLIIVLFAPSCDSGDSSEGSSSDYCDDDYTRTACPTQVNWVLEFGPTNLSDLPNCDGSDVPMDHAADALSADECVSFCDDDVGFQGCTLQGTDANSNHVIVCEISYYCGETSG